MKFPLLVAASVIGFTQLSAQQADTVSAAALQARVTQVRYFERGWNSTDFPFGSQWDVSQARTIGIMLDFAISPIARAVIFAFTCQKTTPSGERMWLENAAVPLQPGWTQVSWTPGAWGWQVAGNWEVGTHRYECYSGGQRIAQGSFEIHRQADLVLDSVTADDVGARVVQVRFFERGRADKSFPYGVRWDAAQARYIGIMLDLELPPVERKVRLNYSCISKTPSGKVNAPQHASAPLEPGWTRLSWTPGAWGWATGGNWEPGTHTVTCRSGNRQIASGSYQIIGTSVASAKTRRAPAATEEKRGGLLRTVLGAGVGYVAARSAGASTDQTVAAVAKGVELLNQGTATGDAAAAVGKAYAAATASASAAAVPPNGAVGPSSKGTAAPGSYPTRPNVAQGRSFCPGFTMENYETRAFQGGNDAQLFTLCGGAFNYYRMYLNAVEQGYAQADANRTYDAHVKSALVAEQFYKDTKSTGGIRVP